MFPGHARHPFFLDLGVNVPPEAHAGVREGLLGIVGGQSGNGDAAGQRLAEALAEDMVSAVETAQHDEADLGWRVGGRVNE